MQRRLQGLIGGTALVIALTLAFAAPAQAQRILFSSNSGALSGLESVTPFVVQADGSLVPGTPVPVGAQPEGIAITPDARFLYVPTSVAPGVRGYAIGPAGGLVEVPGSPFASGGINTSAAAVTPAGDRLLVANRGTGSNNGADPGSIAVYDIDSATGALTAVAGSPFAVFGLEDPSRLAIAPDGGRAFVTGDALGATFDSRTAVLDIAPATGTLTAVGGSPFASGSKQAVPVVVSPDGVHVFVGNVHLSLGNTISVLAVNQATGALTPVAGSPFATAGTVPLGLSLAPDGQRLFSGERGPASEPTARGVSGYDVSAAGALAAVAGSPFGSGEREVRGTVASPTGQAVYGMTSAAPGVVVGFSIGLAGALAPLPGSPYLTGDQYSNSAPIAITPVQTPQPRFGPTAVERDVATVFDAAATTVTGGAATRYDWSFGDGTVLADGGPTPSHRYAANGEYKVSLTVTNDCDPGAVFSGDVVFTGQTAHCNGPRKATVAQIVTVADPPQSPVSPQPPPVAPEVTGLTIKPRFRAGSKAMIRYTLSKDARVTIGFEKRKPKAKKGSRFRALKATIQQQRKAGHNAVPFSGRIGKRTLAPGVYRVVVTATDAAGLQSSPARKRFTILPPK